MDAFHDLAEMTRDYGLIRYFLITIGVALALMAVLFLWGHVPDPDEAGPAVTPTPPAASSTY